ncbi:MAG: FAD:protein FMN transferase [Eudoraea sp.]|nr:FAD:protein FMN transferase [Eudoraea sp.]
MYRILFFLIVLGVSNPLSSQEAYTQTLKLMGSKFDITVVANDETVGAGYIDLAVNEIRRIEKLISSWDPYSETSRINQNAGVQPVQVSTELFDLINRALEISKITDGAFDISYASMDKIWIFDGSMTQMPTKEEIHNSVEKVGYQHILMDKDQKTVFLAKKGMKIGFGGIGKGYAADKAKALLIDQGVIAGIINASGDMNTWGKQPNGEEWQVAITNPLNQHKVFAILPIKEGAVVTSGNYEKYVSFNGTRYSHIIDPRSGYPSSGIISATVFAPSAELADALATAIFVMGTEVGIDRINQLPQIECIIIDDKGGIITSEHIKIQKT